MVKDKARDVDLIKVLYKDKSITLLEHHNDWVDVTISYPTHNLDLKPDNPNLTALRNSFREQSENNLDFEVKAGQAIKIFHGFCLQLPENKEADLRPRGSLFNKTGLIFACSGVIDNGYNGDDDEWFSVFYATRDCTLKHNQKICQFRTVAKQTKAVFTNADSLGNKNRGGHGSTGD